MTAGLVFGFVAGERDETRCASSTSAVGTERAEVVDRWKDYVPTKTALRRHSIPHTSRRNHLANHHVHTHKTLRLLKRFSKVLGSV